MCGRCLRGCVHLANTRMMMMVVETKAFSCLLSSGNKNDARSSDDGYQSSVGWIFELCA